jgi:hypothetical protein
VWNVHTGRGSIRNPCRYETENWEITLTAGHPESQECSEEAVAEKCSLTDIGTADVIPARIEQHWR